MGAAGGDVGGLPTSSSLKAIMETARKTASVEPVMVVMRSGQEPSEMVMRALLWGRCHTPSGTSRALSSMSFNPQGRAHRGWPQCLQTWALPLPPAPGSFPRVQPCLPWVHLGMGGARAGQVGAPRCRQDRQQDPAASQHTLTCSRILLTVSPFCGERIGVGGQVQGSPGLAVPQTPNLTLPMMLPISCKGRDEGGCVSRQLPACHIPPLPTAWLTGNGQALPRSHGETGCLDGDTGACQQAPPWLRVGEEIPLGMLFPGECGAGEESSVWQGAGAPAWPPPQALLTPRAAPSPPTVTLPCMSMRRVSVMLSSVSSGLPPTPLAPSGDAMAGGRAEPAGHGGLQKGGRPQLIPPQICSW